MKRKVVTGLCMACVLIGFIIFFGTAGASDCGTIGFTQIIGQCFVGILFAGTGVLIGVTAGV